MYSFHLFIKASYSEDAYRDLHGQAFGSHVGALSKRVGYLHDDCSRPIKRAEIHKAGRLGLHLTVLANVSLSYYVETFVVVCKSRYTIFDNFWPSLMMLTNCRHKGLDPSPFLCHVWNIFSSFSFLQSKTNSHIWQWWHHQLRGLQ
jgi:hypothetical protein